MADPTRLLRALRRTALHAVPTMLAIVVLNFLLLKLAPGDAADVIAGESGFATPETMALLRQSLGLDLPVLQQLLAYLGNLAQFSLGFSARYNMPVAELIAQRLPATLLLMGSALTLALADRGPLRRGDGGERRHGARPRDRRRWSRSSTRSRASGSP